jgi:hypothetical protein
MLTARARKRREIAKLCLQERGCLKIGIGSDARASEVSLPQAAKPRSGERKGRRHGRVSQYRMARHLSHSPLRDDTDLRFHETIFYMDAIGWKPSRPIPPDNRRRTDGRRPP